MSNANSDASEVPDSETAARPPGADFASRWNLRIVIRRLHLYSGLFLLPWVILYGITGAMFNHLELFPRAAIQPVPKESVDLTKVSEFPTADTMALQVTEALRRSGEIHDITLPEDIRPSYTGDVMFEVKRDGLRHVLQIDPVSHATELVTHPPEDPAQKNLNVGLSRVELKPDPHDLMQQAAGQMFGGMGFSDAANPAPLGWTKLNFLATVDERPVRITYVLKDGHIDVSPYNGQSGMPWRQWFLRMHTTHGQPPYWNGRMFWSLAVDIVAVAMVCWGLTGLYMWWQIKRTRRIGIALIALSLLTAAVMTLSLADFYATTRL
ncbi:MAG: PepSY domain-containing protein [Planctomycetaceae bacterium]|nr:PepSY domain-containing protein [Planctomycetaceae bacterium]